MRRRSFFAVLWRGFFFYHEYLKSPSSHKRLLEWVLLQKKPHTYEYTHTCSASHMEDEKKDDDDDEDDGHLLQFAIFFFGSSSFTFLCQVLFDFCWCCYCCCSLFQIYIYTSDLVLPRVKGGRGSSPSSSSFYFLKCCVSSWCPFLPFFKDSPRSSPEISDFSVLTGWIHLFF